MRIKELLKEDDAVSPVIGVILMVAITVILAAVIATFVLGLGEQVSQSTPNASFTNSLDQSVNDSGSGTSGDFGGSVTDNSTQGILTITHAGGPSIEANRLSLQGSDLATGDTTWTQSSNFGEGDDVTAGKSVDIAVETDDTIQVIWESDEDSAVLDTWEGPGS